MKECRLRFKDATLTSLDWCVIESTDGSVVDRGEAESKDIRGIVPLNVPVTVFLPQSEVLMIAAQLPPRASKQQIGAIGYAVEDQLAADVDSCFFAVGAQLADHRVPVLVIDQGLMDQVVDLLNQSHLNLRAIFPEGYLCPEPGAEENTVSLCPCEAGYLIRSATHAVLFSEASLVGTYLESLADHAADPLVVECYDSEIDAAGLGSAELRRKDAIDLLVAPMRPEQCINLRQKQYQTSHQWLSVVKHWRWPAVAAMLLAIVWIANVAVELRTDQLELASLRQAQRELLQSHLPDARVGANPKSSLARHLADQRVGQDKAGFVEKLYQYSRIQTAVGAVKTGKVQYQNGNLAVSIESTDLASIEEFRNRLAQAEIAATIENINISPGKSTGRVVIRDTEQ